MFNLQGNRNQPTKIQMLCMPLLLASQVHQLREGLSTSPLEMPNLFHPFIQLPILTSRQPLEPNDPSSFLLMALSL